MKKTNTSQVRDGGVRFGFSLIEILIVVGLFAILATIASQSTLLSLRGARKSDSLADVREDLDYALAAMERGLRSSQSITTACNGTVTQRIDYIDEYEAPGSFRCFDINGDTIIEVASGSGTPLAYARLTSNDVRVTSCEIICTTPLANTPPYIDIAITGTNVTGVGTELSPVTVDTRVNLRVY